MQKKFEAREFLSKEKRNIAINRFKSHTEALDFINNLYNCGATKIVATGITNYKSDEDMSVDRLIIELPQEKDKRSVLFSICNKEVEDEGFDPISEEGQKEIELWWD